MGSNTIDFGIDLGTTNSSIAMWAGNGRIEVFKNREQASCTASAVSINKRDAIMVGESAKNAIKAKNNHNVVMEFKQDMGKDLYHTFPQNGRKMNPQELSAEVLKSLKKDVVSRYPNFQAAVITIPAAFNRSEIDATNQAAKLAGFSASPLCIEPVAAAMAYGHQNCEQDGFWLIFDFGGGTFDAAVVQLKDEEFQLVNHQGDNDLGGKLIDWSILDQILIPTIQKEFNLPEFGRQSDDPLIRSAIAKLKLATEMAKIRLSYEDQTDIDIDDLITLPSGKRRHFSFDLTRSAVNRMAEPYIMRAINLCKDALKEKRLGTQNIDKLILVGGPTQMPIFREMLMDPNVGLGIPLEFSVDPMTVVAQGAAIFARTQKLADQQPAKAVSGTININLNLPAADADQEPWVGGELLSTDLGNFEGYCIEFSNPTWQSGAIGVQPDGKFMTQLYAERGENAYSVQVLDSSGNLQKSEPETISYLCQPLFKEIPLTHTIRVAKADNTTDVMFTKGAPLPQKKLKDYRTTVELVPGETDSAIIIPLVEGSNERADRNQAIGYLMIRSDQVERRVPMGSTVEFTLSIDSDQRLVAKADIPILDLETEFEMAIDLATPEVEKEKIKNDVTSIKNKYEQLAEKAQNLEDPEALAILDDIKNQRLVEEIDTAFNLFENDESDNGQVLVNRLRNLRVELDELEDILEWPSLVEEATKEKNWCKEEVENCKYADSTDEQNFQRISKDMEEAIQQKNPDHLRRVIADLDELYFIIVHKDPGWWVQRFEVISEKRSELTDQTLANNLISQCHRAIDNNDLEGLKSALRQLYQLLPKDKEFEIGGLDQRSTVM